uniref:non-specific serine/threonine protein kinase n=1 Tax=Crassostrea virginica TaxID=6565 RepID=A0A8B8BDB1_CRAVI|nr:serine/threonine-protein kinase Nek6-like isoform X1 [Crassostrea virginica]
MEEEETVLEFEAVLGHGSFGTVYLIKDKENRRYAVKRINFQGQESERTQALREAELLSKVRHEHILNYIESFEDDECLNIVTEYCDGGDLEVYLRNRNGKSLPEVRVCHWIYQTASGLQYLHAQKILHRDLKAKNIFLMSDLSLKLGDLGIAKLLELNQSKAMSFVGTPAYMSPELFKHLPYNHKSDIWSFGCCCYEMVALQKAFGNDSLFALCKKVCSDERPPFPSNYSESLKSIIYSMLDEEPLCRPSASDIIRNVYIKKRLTEPIDKSYSPDRQNKKNQPKMREGQSKTHSARERRRKLEQQKYQTMSHVWLAIKRQIDTYRRDNQRKSVSRTMEKMKKLKLGSVKQQSDETIASTYSNRGDTTDYDDDPIRYLLSDDDEDEESTLVISKVERSNARVRQNGDTGSQRSLTDDEVFSVRENVERMTVNPNQAAKLMVQGMREQLTPFQYNGTPFPVRRQESDPNSQESSSDIKGKPRKKKKILAKIADEKKRIESSSSDTGIGMTSGESSPTSNSVKGQGSVRLYTRGQEVTFKRGLSNSSDEREDSTMKEKYVPFEKRVTTDTVRGIVDQEISTSVSMIGNMESESVVSEISNVQSEVASAIGKDNLQKCYDVMANVQDEELVKALLTEILGPTMFKKYRDQLFYLRMLEIRSSVTS